MNSKASSGDLRRRHILLAAWCFVLVFAMVGAAYAAVPLYRMFCQLTGFDGTPRVATRAPDTILEKTVTIRFDGNVAPGLPWRFEPVQTTMQVKIGENMLAFFRATNVSGRTVKGTATYNVFPEVAAVYFNKIQCFCFTEQVLEPGQSVEFPVSFFVDPQIVNDKDARNVNTITLSYTFHIVPTPNPSGVAAKGGDKSG
jgi:cytochrome c oxidase assembly protein subunit 11